MRLPLAPPTQVGMPGMCHRKAGIILGVRRLWILLLLLLVVLGLTGAILWFNIPRLVAFNPADGSLDVSGSERIQLNFSRSMQPETVYERLKIDPEVPGDYTWQGRNLVFTPQTPWPSGVTVQLNLEKGARAAGLLSLPTLVETSWSFTIRQPRLLYLYPSDQAANIYQYDPRTQEINSITNLLPGILEFDPNKEGSAIYYSIKNTQGGSDIYRLNLKNDGDTPETIQILTCQQAQCRAPRVSDREEYLAYERTPPPGQSEGGFPQVWYLALPAIDNNGNLANPPDTAPQRAGNPQHQTIQPDWSSDNKLIFYNTNQQAFIVFDPGNGITQSLSNQTGEPGSWDPSGQAYIAPEIFFNQGGNPETTPDLKPVASSHLLLYLLADGSFQDLTQLESLEDTSPAFSPDGKLLAFARKYLDITRWTPGRQLWVMNSDGTEPHQLTNQPNFNHYAFAWDPSGKKIAFVRFDQTAPINLPVIWEIDLESEIEFELVIGGYSPRWIP